MTLHQNAKKIVEYTEGKMNVFVIDNKLINDKYHGDMDKLVQDIKNAPPNTIFTTSYDCIGNNADADPNDPTQHFERAQALSGAAFDCVSLDESQKIKNPDTSRHQALQYFSGAKYKRLATGTFISKDPGDVVGQLSWLYPGRTQNLDEFAKQYGFTKSKLGYTWSDTGVKKLREDLLSKGFISIRRTNWLHLLKDRNEKTSVVKLEPKQALANESAISDAMDALDNLASGDPKIQAELNKLNDDSDDDEKPTGKVIDAINTLTGIVDHPHEFAQKVKKAKDICDKAGVDYTYDEEAWKKGGEIEGADNISNKEVKAAQRYLKKFRSQTLKSILNLDGEVSAKAKDAYKKMAEHFKDPKNGKFIVFTKRINSARHVFDNLPPELKKMAVYYDGSNKEGLAPFLDEKDKSGPKIIVACDESIKEGVNMQIANGMYRYDLGWTPGDNEQSYGRIWRFGQDKPVNIHVGISDGSLDVTKYARLASRHNSNMKVTSDYDEIPGFTAFKMSVDNMRNNRNADLLPQYEEVSHAVMRFQKEENKKIHAAYGDKMHQKAGKGVLPGSQKATGNGYVTLDSKEPESDEESDQGAAKTPVTSDKSRSSLAKESSPLKPKEKSEPIKQPSSKKTQEKPEQVEKPSNKGKVASNKGQGSDLTPEENNEAAEHHLKHAAFHIGSENKGLAKKHWKKAVQHLKKAGKGKRDAHLTHLAKDHEAFKAYAKSVKKKHGDLPEKFVPHEHDKRLPADEENPQAQTPPPKKQEEKKPEPQPKPVEKKQDVLATLTKVLDEDGFEGVDDSTMAGLQEDLDGFMKHTDKGLKPPDFWKKWAKKFGDQPEDEHKAAIERAANILRGKK
jgi:hypothetical protein